MIYLSNFILVEIDLNKMKYLLKNNRDGSPAVYKTTLCVSQDERYIYFDFVAEHSDYYCPYGKYNDIHSCGDAVEVLIGTDPTRKTYYELEVNPNNVKMLAKMTVTELDDDGAAKLNIEFVDEKDCFFTSSTAKTPDGYIACIVIDKAGLNMPLDKIYFNAYRLETDGGEMEKHLFALNPTMCGKFHVPTRYVMLSDYLAGK
mgnify:FL=1